MTTPPGKPKTISTFSAFRASIEEPRAAALHDALLPFPQRPAGAGPDARRVGIEERACRVAVVAGWKLPHAALPLLLVDQEVQPLPRDVDLIRSPSRTIADGPARGGLGGDVPDRGAPARPGEPVRP